MHRHNPVDWYPWGEAALQKARSEQKPIFLSIGYSTCYWCHVMERLVFEDPKIAALMNAHFVNIKVDREERPDLDEIYMAATQLMTGSGGWPNSVFLTPDAAPFFAGTYFPPEDQHGHPGFPRVLTQLADLWHKDRAKLLEVGAQVARALDAAQRIPLRSQAIASTEQLFRQALAALAQRYDSMHAGFGAQPKFPNPTYLELLLAAQSKQPNPHDLSILTHTLAEMALGGIQDHLGGGFHRYATDRAWSIPHFEKMLYDNAQLLGLYARSYALTKDPLYRYVAEEIATYLEQEMWLSDGGFASAQDAEVGESEGASYVWSAEEISAVLGSERAREFLAFYQLVAMHETQKCVLRISRRSLPSHPHGRDASPEAQANWQRDSAGLVERLESFRAERKQLLAARRARPQPVRDEKVLVSWNALAIKNLIEAGRILDHKEWIELAKRGANFLFDHLLDEDGVLCRSWIAGQRRERAILDDYVFLADACLALFRETENPFWNRKAKFLMDEVMQHYADRERGGFFLTHDSVHLLVRPKSYEDQVMPSANGVALRVLRELAGSLDPTERARFGKAASDTLSGCSALLSEVPFALGSTLLALAGTGRQACDQETCFVPPTE